MSQFTIIENTKTVIRSFIVNDKQFAQVQALRAALKKDIATNDEIRAASLTLFGMKYAPYYIYRNLAVRVKREHKLFFDLSVLRTKDICLDMKAVARPKREKHAKIEVQKTIEAPAVPLLPPAHEEHSIDAELDSIEQKLIEA